MTFQRNYFVLLGEDYEDYATVDIYKFSLQVIYNDSKTIGYLSEE
jgi:hypothetical protein